MDDKREMRILDLGCGNKKRPGAIGVDNNGRTGADVVHNLNVFPYPFADSSFDVIYLDNVLEHLDDVMKVMEEIHRIGSAGSMVKVIVPYFRSRWAFIDPTHKHFFTVDSLAYFDPSHPICKRYDYTLARFSVERVVFNETLADRFYKKPIKFLANRWPRAYEGHASHWFPLDEITYYLRVLK